MNKDDYSTAAVYICTILGAGFATGQELNQYFVQYGLYGMAGLILSSILFGIVAYKAVSLPFSSYTDYINYRLPPLGAKIILFATMLFTLVLCSAMLAGGGELIAHYTNIPLFLGNCIIAVFTLLFILKGAEGLSTISRSLCIPIVITAVIIGLYITSMPKTASPPGNRPIGLIIPIVYVSYNILTAAAVIIGKRAKNIGSVSFAALTLLGFSLALPLYKFYSSISAEPMPILALLPATRPITIAYLILLSSAIITTAISTAYAASVQLKPYFGSISCYITMLISLLLSLIGFSAIVARVYFVFGIIGIIVLYIILSDKNKSV